MINKINVFHMANSILNVYGEVLKKRLFTKGWFRFLFLIAYQHAWVI